MDKETLRMQMLAGVITESEYKAKVEEETEFKSELGGGNLMLNNASKQIYQYIKKNGFPVRLVTDKGQVIGDPNPNFIVSTKTDYLTKFDQKQGIDGLKSIVTKIGISGGGLYISGIGTNAPVVKDKLEGLQRDILSSFNFLEKAGEVQVGPTGGGFALRIKPDMLKKGEVTEALNEHYVAGGIVGIGAITQIPSRAKADYEDAFEHFLGQKYEIKEEMEEDEPSDFGGYLNRLNPSETLKVGDITTIFGSEKNEGKKVKITKDLGNGAFEMEFVEDEDLDEGKEVEEPTNY